MTEALKLWVFFGDSQLTGAELTSDALMDCFARHEVAVSALCRGIEGFGLGRRIHTERFPDVSTDLPLVACAVDTRARIEAVLEDVDAVVADGLVTLEHALLVRGEELAEAPFPSGPGRADGPSAPRLATGPGRADEPSAPRFPSGPGRAAKLTVFCGRAERTRGGRRPAYRVAVDVLRRHGVAGATALLGVDGTYHGRRQRAAFHAPRRHAPLMIVSVGRRETLEAALPELSRALERPLATLEGIAQLKHDGEQLEELPRAEGRDRHGLGVWQTIRVYTRQSAQVNGRALYTELTRRLREGGAAGATTVRGHWGFSSDERPHGDRFGRLTSHAPTYTTYIDTPARVAAQWPAIDEVTAEHGIVTSLFVPAYRERRGEQVGGGLRLAELGWGLG